MLRIPKPVDVIVLCLSGTGLSVARILGRQGLNVVGVDPRRWEIGHFSRYVTGTSTLTLQHIAEIAGEDRPVLFACGDAELRWVLDNRTSLRPIVRLPESLADGTATSLLDKRIFYRRCAELGIAVARTWIPDNEGDVLTAAREALFPVLVKPALGYANRYRFGGAKLAFCQTREQLQKAVWDPSQVIIQEHIPGPESELCVFATHVGADGVPGPVMTGRKIRQLPKNHGSGTRVVTEANDEVVERSLELLSAFNYRGPCGLEWKRTPEGLLHIETNPRPVLWYGLAAAVVLDAWADLSDRPRPSPLAIESGLEWQYLVRDMVASPFRAWPLGQVFCLGAKDDMLPGLLAPMHAAVQYLALRR